MTCAANRTAERCADASGEAEVANPVRDVLAELCTSAK